MTLADLFALLPYVAMFGMGIFVAEIVPWIKTKLKARESALATEVATVRASVASHLTAIEAGAKSILNLNNDLARLQAQLNGAVNNVAANDAILKGLLARVANLEPKP